MNEFIEQFLIESRELIEQATDDLLTLEGKPNDVERIDGAFRAFHTLKGAAGIVDFDAMARALHAAEDVLALVRAGEEPVSLQLISDCLTCLDQVAQWLDAMQADGQPPAGADAAAEALVRRFQRTTAPGVASDARAKPDWVEALVARHRLGGASVALRYAPEPDAFLRGQDPLSLLAAVPSLLALELDESEAWPPLVELDPFGCRLVFLALAACTTIEARQALHPASGQFAVHEIAPRDPRAGDLSLTAQRLVEAQLQLLGGAPQEGLVGRMASAARVAANVLQYSARGGEVGAVERALARSLEAGSPDDLAEAIRGVLEGVLGAPAAHSDSVVFERAPVETAARTLRVDVERIDALVNLTGELLVAKNALGHASARAQDGMDLAALAAMLKDQHAVLQRLVEELQRSVLNIRVLQMRYVFQRFPRLVREMVVSLGKPAHLVTEGDETEADKVIVESLFEPLLHVLRNALDHGVESPAARAAAGKPAAATITLRARRQNDNVVVEVEDDGAGVDVVRVREVAAQRGVASKEALAQMSDEEATDLIFSAGFSTAAEVTNLSGRGVGMDAVRTAIERLGGRATVESRAGEGTTVRFLLPFAVLMSRVLTVEAGGQLFGIPLEAIRETVRVRRSEIKPIGAAQAFVWRDRTVPLIDLGEALGAQTTASISDEANVIVATAAGQLVGVRVDRLGARLEVMLKPLDGLLTGMPALAGTTLLGDGRVLLVLDLQELLQ